MSEDIIVRCSFCRWLGLAPLGSHGERCPMCGSGNLTTIARPTPQMFRDAELAEMLLEGA